MSSTRCQAFNWLLVPLAAAALLSLISPIPQHLLLYALTAIVTTAHIHYGACVVSPKYYPTLVAPYCRCPQFMQKENTVIFLVAKLKNIYRQYKMSFETWRQQSILTYLS